MVRCSRSSQQSCTLHKITKEKHGNYINFRKISIIWLETSFLLHFVCFIVAVCWPLIEQVRMISKLEFPVRARQSFKMLQVIAVKRFSSDKQISQMTLVKVVATPDMAHLDYMTTGQRRVFMRCHVLAALLLLNHSKIITFYFLILQLGTGMVLKPLCWSTIQRWQSSAY